MKLIFIVTLAHFLVLFCFNLKKDIHEPKKNKIIVRTEKLLPIVAKAKVEKKQIEPQKAPEVAIAPVAPVALVVAPPIVEVVEKKEEPKKQQPTPKKVVTTTPNKTPVKAPQKKPTPVAKKTTPTNTKQAPAKKAPDKELPNKELLDLMKEGLSKIDKASTSLQKKSSVQSFDKIGALKSESLEATAIELSYAEELALYLKHRLHFPDEGTMKVALTLSREGKVESFNIIASSSSGNQTIAQRSLSSISFPPFKDRFKERTKTFTLQLNIDSG